MPTLKKEKAGSLSRPDRLKLQRLYTQGGAVDGSVRNLVKTSKLPLSKLRLFLHPKHLLTKYNLAKGIFKRMKAFDRFKNEICCLNLAYVERQAKDNNSLKYLLVRQALFGKIVDAKGTKTKVSEETVRAFLNMITKKLTQQGLARQGNRVCWRI